MREPNHSFPLQNRAAVCISPQLYDRRALDGPVSGLPLIGSLSHLAYLTSTSPRIREILTLDGGLERLVAIVLACLRAATRTHPEEPVASTSALARPGGSSPFRAFASYSTKTALQLASHTAAQPAINRLTPRSNLTSATAHARALLITYTLSLQSLVNVGVRGSESVRTRVVEAGVLTVASAVLRGYLEERERLLAQAAYEFRKTVKPNGSSSSARRESSTPAPLRARASEPALPANSAPASPTQAGTFATPSNPVPPLSAQSSQVPTRVGTPDSLVLLQGAALAVADEGTGNSSEEGEMDQERDEELLPVDLPVDVGLPVASAADDSDMDLEPGGTPGSTALASRGRQRSATLKSPIGRRADPDEDEPMEAVADSQPASQDMDVEMTDAAADTAQPGSPASTVASTVVQQTSRRPRLSMDQTASPSLNAPLSALNPPPRYDGFRYRDEDILLCLQLLAFLSKYPHVRAAFHDPASDYACSATLAATQPPPPPADKGRNVFSLVEKYTVAPGDHRSVLAPFCRTDLQRKMLAEIHYWAGVIMRNACRKDEARGGIRQCANMLCGAWEAYPREFAKCRRCRKAKYCSKECQKKAWHGGHRFWCSMRDAEVRPEEREEDTAAIQRFIEHHPELANNPDALTEIARRLRHSHRAREAGGAGGTPEAQRRRTRSRANTLPADAAAAPFILRPTFNEDEDAEEEDAVDQVADNAIEIAGVDTPDGLLGMADVAGIRLDAA